MMELNRVHNMPCIQMFAGLEEQAALIISDPPYGINYVARTTHRKPLKGFSRNSGAVRETPITFQGDTVIDTSWIAPAYNVLKDGGAMYLFTRWDVLHKWQEAAQQAGFIVKQCIVWNKCHWGAGDLKHYGPQFENIIYCIKGDHELRWYKRSGNVWDFATSTMMTLDGGGKHPTQKPVALFNRIIQYSSSPNDLVLDPFSGSGAACIAAQRLRRRFVGSDISKTFTDAANIWLEEDRRTNAQTRMNAMF